MHYANANVLQLLDRYFLEVLRDCCRTIITKSIQMPQEDSKQVALIKYVHYFSQLEQFDRNYEI